MSHAAPASPWLLALAIACQPSQPAETPEPAVTTQAEVPESAATPAPESPSPPDTHAPAIETLFVREQRVDCQGEAPMKCLQVRNSETEAWRNFYAGISLQRSR